MAISANTYVDKFITNAKSNGVNGLRAFLRAFDHAVVYNDGRVLARLLNETEKRDAQIFKKMVMHVVGPKGAKLVKTADGQANVVFAPGVVDRSESVATVMGGVRERFDELVGLSQGEKPASFRGEAVAIVLSGAKVKPSKTAMQLAEKLLKDCTTNGVDMGHVLGALAELAKDNATKAA